MRTSVMLAVLTCVAIRCASAEVPFPTALERSAVTLSTLDDPINDALILGNGDLNALVFAEGDDLVIRITKNDVWDARLDTALDPPTPTLARLKELAQGDWPDRDWILPEGSTWQGPDSYHAHPYPCPRVCGVVRVTGAAALPLVAKLDIRRALLTVDSASGAYRVYIPAESNRIVVERIHDNAGTFFVNLIAVASDDIPSAQSGRDGDVAWVSQAIPGDPGWPGMDFAVALATSDSKAVVSVVTSLEAEGEWHTAAVDAAEGLAADELAEHETTWDEFWSRSGIDLFDPVMERVWYRNLYLLRCVSKPGVVSTGLFAGLLDDKPAWHGDYHTNYNIQQTYWAAYSANHGDLTEPYDRLIAGYLPRARWIARTVFDMDGAYIPHVLYAYEPTDPEQCAQPNGRQYIHHVWGFSLCVAGFSVQPLWWHYKYEPDRKFLENTAYPAVRDVADFQAAFVEQCERDGDRVVLAPTVSPEHWGWTDRFERNRNCTFDIAMFRYIFDAAAEGASILGIDEDRVARWKNAAALLPEYPTWSDDPQTVVDVEGAPPIEYNIPVPTSPVFPCDVVTFFSPESERALFANTLEHLRHNGNNAPIMLAIARARLSTPDAWDFLRTELGRRERNNGTLSFNRLVPPHQFNVFGHYTEMFGAALPVTELLLQSVGGVIRIFPAWPLNIPAKFASLRAEGGFLVTAAVDDGKVGPVRIESTVGGLLRLVAPWEKTEINAGGTWQPATLDASRIIEVQTQPGVVVELRQRKD